MENKKNQKTIKLHTFFRSVTDIANSLSFLRSLKFPVYVILILLFCFQSAIHAESLLQEIKRVVSKHHISQPPAETIFVSSLAGVNEYLKTLDPYSKYLSVEEYIRLRQIEAGNYIGIGAELVPDGNGILLIPFNEGPAYKAGIKTPHRLNAINGRRTSGMDVDDIGGLLKGTRGSVVKLDVSSLDGNKHKFYSIVSSNFFLPPVEIIKETSFVYLRIHRFISRRTVSSLKVALEKIKAKGLPIILDLRNSPGGDLYEAMDALSLFLPGWMFIGKLVKYGGDEQIFYSLPDQQIVFKKILIFIGPATASAGEVFVATLKHYSKAVVIGQQTYGKCTSQAFYELSDRSALKLTNSKIIYSSGEHCNRIGIIPDIMVEDSQLYQTETLISKGLKQMQ
jgi:carboxyl-terminal processing protease